MKLKNTKFKDLKIVNGINFYDQRGFFREIYKAKLFNKYKPIFWCVSKSKKNVLRGLHIQKKNKQGKFVSVLKGKIFDVAVDLRKNSKTFGKYYRCTLSEKNGKSVFIPPGFAHGFQALENENYIVYSCTQYRHSTSESVIQFNDKELNIKWPLKEKIVSKKDNNAMSLEKFIKI